MLDVISLQTIIKMCTFLCFLFSFLFLVSVRAGTGGDEAGLWAGDLVGTRFLCPSSCSYILGTMPCFHQVV